MSEIQTQPLPSFLRMMVSATARHLLTGIAGALATAGVIQGDQQTQFVAIAGSIVLWSAGLIWSAMQKKATLIPQPDPAADPPH